MSITDELQIANLTDENVALQKQCLQLHRKYSAALEANKILREAVDFYAHSHETINFKAVEALKEIGELKQ